jgi:hypothetical protein
VKDIPVDWPTPFIFAEPVAIRRGTTLVVTAYASGDGKSAPPAGVRVTLSVAKPTS